MLVACAASRPTPPRLELGLHAASHYTLFDEQADADAANFVFPALLTAAEAAACAQLLVITGKATDMFPLAFSPGFLWVSPSFLQRARLAKDSGFALAERLVWELVKEVISLLSLFLRDFVLVVDSRVFNGVSCNVPAVAEEIAFMRRLFAPSRANIDVLEEVPVSYDAVQGHVLQQPELADFEPMIETISDFSSACLFLLLEQAIKCANLVCKTSLPRARKKDSSSVFSSRSKREKRVRQEVEARRARET